MNLARVFVVFAWVTSAALCGGMATAEEATLRVLQDNAPRAYGYQVGDVLQRRVLVQVPAGWRVDATSLPRAGQRGAALELRQARFWREATRSGEQLELQLQYQVFLSPPQVRTLEIAPLTLRFIGPARSEDLRIEAWPVTVAPLVPAEVSPRRGLGELQDDRPPPLLGTAAVQARLGAYAALALLLAAGLAFVYLGPPWRAARNRPFAVAWRALRGLPAQASAEQWREACRQFHAALNRSAGEVLFEAALPRFVQQHPGFAPLQAELQAFLRESRLGFFADQPPQAGSLQRLQQLCRRCRAAERGLL